MKKQLIFGSFIALSGFLNAQATWSGSGTTGNANRSGNIGINNTSPTYALDVTSSTYDNGIRVKNGLSISNVGVHLDNTPASGNRWAIMSMGSGDPWGGAGNFALYNYGSPGGSLPSLFISGGLGSNPANGNVGMGTIAPAAKLDILSTSNQLRLSYTSSIFSDLQTTSSGNLYINPTGGKVGIGTSAPIGKLNVVQSSNTAFQIDQTSTGNYEYAQVINVSSDLTKAIGVQRVNGATSTTVFQLWGNGVVNAKSLYAEAITVTPSAIGISWPDYVFNKDYKLMPLKDLEKYIQINHHLPNVPSTDDVTKEGVNLYEINKALLEKVEELSLHVIELNKKIELIQQKSK